MLRDIIVDFSEVGESSFEPLPPGIYYVVIDASSATEIMYGKEKSTPYINLSFIVTEPEDYAGRKIFENFPIAGKGAFRFKALRKALGYDDPQDQVRVSVAELHNRELAIKVSHRTFDGSVRNKIDSFIPLGDAQGAA